MYLLLILGIGMIGFGCYMIGKPLQFSKGIVRFSDKKWFHPFEILSRLIIAIALLMAADRTSYPTAVSLLGGLLCFVGVFLVVIGPIRHKRFALLTSSIGKGFRALGVVAIACGASIVYLGLV